ncbi:hypothetical protein [Photobacterium chitinilyticum]|uniref:DUF4402 domain-containing protein n=1 Tax=Photobacterium chitinilyticum TaxID=2485123 RepID=A0A3S3QUA5_9GAMM|nr:hypothetical protein [Photobacterium chitinilyticum]RWX56890.1 hypothetical protein EDI28_02260 [Photobacterium chitinilyticum]
MKQHILKVSVIALLVSNAAPVFSSGTQTMRFKAIVDPVCGIYVDGTLEKEITFKDTSHDDDANYVKLNVTNNQGTRSSLELSTVATKPLKRVGGAAFSVRDSLKIITKVDGADSPTSLNAGTVSSPTVVTTAVGDLSKAFYVGLGALDISSTEVQADDYEYTVTATLTCR